MARNYVLRLGKSGATGAARTLAAARAAYGLSGQANPASNTIVLVDSSNVPLEDNLGNVLHAC